jgi:catechol 2,3-dioxygenase-like lactoylglutathione lyase family enzyme
MGMMVVSGQGGGPLRAIHHVGITVRDVDVSLAFYHEILGLRLIVPPTPWFEGSHLAKALGVDPPVSLRVALFEVGDGDTWFEILEYRSPASTTEVPPRQSDIGAAHVAFLVDDIARTYEDLLKKGVAFNSEPNTVDDGPLAGWRWVYFKDPDEHTIELVEVAYVRDDQRRADLAAFLASRSADQPGA